MNLMNLIRGLVALLVCYTIAALGLGVLGTRGVSLRSTEYYSPTPAFSDAVPVWGNRVARGEHVLVDTRTGALEPIRLPDEEGWGFLSVSPWRDRQGKLLAVGRWVRSNREGTEEPLWGLGVLRLPDATVVERSPLDLLPTGRPCWLPDAPGSIVFPAADGQLHRADLNLDAAPQGEGLTLEPSAAARRGLTRVRPVSLAFNPAGDSQVLIQDPVVSSDPRLRRILFAAVSLPGGPGARKTFQAAKVWWLELGVNGEQIVAAGPLEASARQSLEPIDIAERHPNIAVHENRIRLVYLARRPGDQTGAIRERELEIDPQTQRPRVKDAAPAPAPAPAAEALALGPLLVSADGGSVFALDRWGKNARRRIGAR